MNAPFAQALLHVDEAVAEQIRVLDSAAYDRFTAAWRFAERALGGSLRGFSGGLSFFVEHGGMNLVIKFCRTRELFMIKSFIDLNDDLDPTPPGGVSRPATIVERLLKAVGAGNTTGASEDGNTDFLRVRRYQISYCERSPFDCLESPSQADAQQASTHTRKLSPETILLVPAPRDFRIVGMRRSAQLVPRSPVTVIEEERVIRPRGSGPPTVP